MTESYCRLAMVGRLRSPKINNKSVASHQIGAGKRTNAELDKSNRIAYYIIMQSREQRQIKYIPPVLLKCVLVTELVNIIIRRRVFVEDRALLFVVQDGIAVVRAAPPLSWLLHLYLTERSHKSYDETANWKR